jgi:5'-phosphate synthase pdxT subunit
VNAVHEVGGGTVANGPARGPIGVLALQGGYEAHERILRGLGFEVRRVRSASDLDAVVGLVLPGGESTAMLKLIGYSQLGPALEAFVARGRPVLATCAGLILAARHVSDPAQKSFGWLDVDVARNAWGRQVESFEARADGSDMPLVFIRAPRIRRVGPGVEVLATLAGEAIAVRQGAVVGVSFHPELAEVSELHARAFGAAAR